MSRRRTAVRGWLAAGLMSWAASVAPAQELTTLTDVVEVRVVNIDVVVSDADGRPVRGLGREDFDLRVNGRPVPVEYFSAVVEGTHVGGVDEGMPADLPYLAIVFDGRSTRPAASRRAIESLADRLSGLLDHTQAIMVVRQGTNLVVEQPMTREVEKLHMALDRLVDNRAPALDVGDRQMLLRQLESSGAPRILRAQESDLEMDSAAEDDIASLQARQLLRQVHIQAQMERRSVSESSNQLRLLTRSMAGLPGRKAILLLGKGLQRRPAEDLYRLWWQKFAEFAAGMGVMNIESEMNQNRSDDLIEALIEDANAHRVTFYSHDPAGPSVAGSSAEFNNAETNLEVARAADSLREALVDLSLATGGMGKVPAGVASLVDDMVSGFGSYYSLGFTPDGEVERGQVRVKIRHPDLRVRYLRKFRARTAAQELEEATLATLLTGAEDNRLQVSVDVGQEEIQPDGTFLVPVLVKVPMAKVSLLPQQAGHVGKLSFVIITQTEDGQVSRPALGEVPIEIANAELLSVMGQVAGYRLRLRIDSGRQVLAIGVRDEVAREDATLRLALTPNRGI